MLTALKNIAASGTVLLTHDRCRRRHADAFTVEVYPHRPPLHPRGALIGIYCLAADLEQLLGFDVATYARTQAASGINRFELCSAVILKIRGHLAERIQETCSF